ncbi:MAG TPA: glycosyl hydrolase, partial [Nitrosospira sp.]
FFAGTLLLIIGTALLPPGGAHAASGTQPLPPEYFGLHIARIAQTQPWYPYGDRITPWPTIKFGSWRLVDAYVGWPLLEPQRGKWNFTALDKYVDLAGKAGIDLVMNLGFTPTWASARPNEPSNYLPGNAAEPRNIDDWRNYVRTVALRYKGRIKYYELWNEVNVPGFYTGSKEKLVELAAATYQILKQVDPGIVFISPSVTGASGESAWLDDYFAKGGAQYADIVSYHFYVPKSPPEAMLPVIQQVQGIMRKHGLDSKPLWNTEIGWWIDNKTSTKRGGGVDKNWIMLDDEHAAAYLARTFILSWPAGVSRVYWYSWDSLDMGLVRPGSLKFAPAAIAYDKVARSLTGGLLKQCTGDATALWTCQLARADGKAVWIVWTGDDVARSWVVPANWNIESAELLDGTSFKVNGNAIRIGMAPIFLVARSSGGTTMSLNNFALPIRRR